MNINAISNYNQTFQAKIKMSSPNKELLKKAATVGLGASAVSYGMESWATVLAPDHLNSMVESLPDNLVDSHLDVLTSAAEKGLPVQSSMAPSSLMTTGSGFINDGLADDESSKIFCS